MTTPTPNGAESSTAPQAYFSGDLFDAAERSGETLPGRGFVIFVRERFNGRDGSAHTLAIVHYDAAEVAMLGGNGVYDAHYQAASILLRISAGTVYEIGIDGSLIGKQSTNGGDELILRIDERVDGITPRPMLLVDEELPEGPSALAAIMAIHRFQERAFPQTADREERVRDLGSTVSEIVHAHLS